MQSHKSREKTSPLQLYSFHQSSAEFACLKIVNTTGLELLESVIAECTPRRFVSCWFIQILPWFLLQSFRTSLSAWAVFRVKWTSTLAELVNYRNISLNVFVPVFYPRGLRRRQSSSSSSSSSLSSLLYNEQTYSVLQTGYRALNWTPCSCFKPVSIKNGGLDSAKVYAY